MLASLVSHNNSRLAILFHATQRQAFFCDTSLPRPVVELRKAIFTGRSGGVAAIENTWGPKKSFNSKESPQSLPKNFLNNLDLLFTKRMMPYTGNPKMGNIPYGWEQLIGPLTLHQEHVPFRIRMNLVSEIEKATPDDAVPAIKDWHEPSQDQAEDASEEKEIVHEPLSSPELR